ncbi:MAG: phage major capsid protein [Chloroflexi bacterium]|nr:phage major capsid protein [Chloroflexota bacterium]
MQRLKPIIERVGWFFFGLTVRAGLRPIEIRDRENHTDAMIARLEKEIEERDAFIQGTVANAQDAERDLADSETELVGEARKRIEACEEQLGHLHEARDRTAKARKRADDVQRELSRMRTEVDHGEPEYRSAGAYIVEAYRAHMGNTDAKTRLEMFFRAADHQTTGDNSGVVPDPIVGSVINFIDAARPIVSATGVQPMTDAIWHRPKVTQRTSVAPQGAAGGAGDEKTELVSQAMVIERLTAEATTYGGYVNVSRQNMDFSRPQIFDTVVNDLAAQYAIQTEAAAAAALEALAPGTPVPLGADAAAITANVWSAASTIYAAVAGQGRLVLAVSPDKLGDVGPLFAPVNPRDTQSEGFTAGQFGQGQMGTISGIPVVMSAGLSADTAALFSTAAFELFEQRVGTLQVTEPSVLGVQVAYAGYFTPLILEDEGVSVFVG